MFRVPALFLLFALTTLSAATADESLISSVPLKETHGESTVSTLFELIKPDDSGITHISPIMADHPLARAYHSSSACAAVAIGDLDLDGEPRFMNGRIDIGADETTARPYLDGDMNCDDFRTTSDIAGFVLALTDPVGYAMSFPDCEIANGDANRDGVVSVSDIAAFVALLTCP